MASVPRVLSDGWIQVLLKSEGMPDLVAQANDQAIWEAEAGEVQVLGLCGLQSEFKVTWTNLRRTYFKIKHRKRAGGIAQC